MQLVRPHRLIAALILFLAALPAWANPDGIAVIVGNRDYGAGIPQVRFALNDATAMKRFVIEVLGYREGNVIALENASQAELYATFGNADNPRGKLWGWAKPGVSDIVVFYSGHGVPGRGDGGQGDGRGYLLPVDADPDTPQINGYPLDLLYRNLAAIGARSATVYLEACFSGDSAGGSLCRNCSGLSVLPRANDVPAGLTVISAAAADQVASWDEEARLGLFTHYLLRGLYGEADGNSDQRVETGELKDWLDAEMTYAARRHYKRVQEASVRGEDERILARLTADTPPYQPVPSFMVVAVERQMTVSARGRINIRAGPGTKYAKVGNIQSGAVVQVTGSVQGRPWFRVALAAGHVGFIHEALLAPVDETKGRNFGHETSSAGPVDPLEGRVRSYVGPVEVYVEPDRRSRQVFVLERNQAVSVTGLVRDTRWLQVRLRDGSIGYVSQSDSMFPLAPGRNDPAVDIRLHGGKSFRDCEGCPEMVPTSGGAARDGRLYSSLPEALEPLPGMPQFIPPIAVGRFEVTRAEFKRFVEASDYVIDHGCHRMIDGYLRYDSSANWQSPGFQQSDHEPVTCVSWRDAKAYVGWLNRVSGKRYRLPDVWEWRYAASGRGLTLTPWHDAASARESYCHYENMADAAGDDCQDGYENTAAVGHFLPNSYLLHDLLGNVAEWLGPCEHPSEESNDQYCAMASLIGGDWTTPPDADYLAVPVKMSALERYNAVGFRVMRPLDE